MSRGMVPKLVVGGWRGNTGPPPLKLSPFGLRIWRECPRHYRFRYVDKLLYQYSRPKAHFTMGDHVHAVLKDFLSRVPLQQRNEEYIEMLLRQKWRRFRHGFRNAEDEKRWAQKALAQVRAFAMTQNVSVNPFMVEASIEAEITPGLVLRGRVDRVDREADGGFHIIDYKTGRVPEVNDWSQLYLYALVFNRRLGLRVSRVSFLYLGPGSLESSEPSREALEHATWELLVTATQIRRARDYLPRKGKWCSSCDFRPLCRETSPQPGGEEVGGLWTQSGGEV